MKHACGGLLLGVALVLPFGAAHAATADARTAQRAALHTAAEDYQAARARCKPQSGHERAVCIAEAKAARARAEAEAQAAFRGTPKAHADAKVQEANADYRLARVKCRAQSGAARSACLKTAKAAQKDAVADAMRSGKAGMASTAMPEGVTQKVR